MRQILDDSNRSPAMNRREAMRVGGLTAFGLSLADLFRLRSLQAASPSGGTFGRAKRILLLYLQGAASQLETWDPKPNAPLEVRGKWSAASTSVPGIQICDQLPRLASLMDRMTIIRSMSHDYNNHSNAYTLTGHPTVNFSSETNPSDSRHHPFFVSVLDYLADQRQASAQRQVLRNVGHFASARIRPCFAEPGRTAPFWETRTIRCGHNSRERRQGPPIEFPSSIA
ncbi:MAG: hypothetical protein CMJ64_05465 [Planctomycetaceae bacterium]|nr:hypothetical protein [Planctomycetaceae bacterium]